VAQAFAKEGGTACASVAELAAACDVVVSVVVNAQQTEDVLFGAGGAASAMKPGSVFVMCSTVDPNVSIAFEQRLQALGLLYLDAPISGGAAKAASGQMTMMTAGTPAAYARCGGALDAMAAKVYRLGDRAGAGSKVKIINQLLAGVHIAAAAEAMALGLREGVDAAALYEVITHSAGNSWMFENRMAHVLAADYTPLSAVDIFVKDLGLVLDTARATKFPLPLASTAHQMFMQASSAGFGREDDSAVIKIFPGIELPKGS
jgi:3-hydroxyisobutyrate dehydrogenase